MSLSDALAAEKNFFATHPTFSKLDNHLVGVDNLTAKLTRVLASRIQHALPDMGREVTAKIRLARKGLSDLGQKPPASINEQRQAFASAVWVRHRLIHFREVDCDLAYKTDLMTPLLLVDCPHRNLAASCVRSRLECTMPAMALLMTNLCDCIHGSRKLVASFTVILWELALLSPPRNIRPRSEKRFWHLRGSTYRK
jgi:Dynamin central region